MSTSTNNTLPMAETPLGRALDHFSRDVEKYTTGLAKEIFRKDIVMPLSGLKGIKPYNYFNSLVVGWHNIDALNGLVSAVVNQIIYATPAYMYDCEKNNNSTQTFLECVSKKHYDTLSLSWYIEKVGLPFRLSSYNPNHDPDLMTHNPELACNLLNQYGQFKTVKAAVEHMKQEYDTWDQASYEYSHTSTVANYNKLFYSAVDFFGSLATGSLAFAFTIGVQRTVNQNNDLNYLIKNSALLVLSYKVAATSMFVAKIAVEFLIKLPINMAYDYCNSNTEDLEIEIISSQYSEELAPQEEYLNQTVSAVTYTNGIKDWSLTKTLTVCQNGKIYFQTKLGEGVIKIIPVALIYLSSHQEQISREQLLGKHFTEIALLKLLHETMITDHEGTEVIFESPAYYTLTHEDLVGETAPDNNQLA